MTVDGILLLIIQIHINVVNIEGRGGTVTSDQFATSTEGPVFKSAYMRKLKVVRKGNGAPPQLPSSRYKLALH